MTQSTDHETGWNAPTPPRADADRFESPAPHAGDRTPSAPPQPEGSSSGYEPVIHPPAGSAYDAPNPWHSPGGSPTAAFAPPAPTAPLPTSQAPLPAASPWSTPTPGSSSPYQSPQGGPYQYPQSAPGGPTSGGSFTPPGPPPAPRGRGRGPGWPGVVAVGVGAALLSSVVTAGLISLEGSDAPGTAAATSQTAPAAPGPVTSSSAANPDWRAVASAVTPSVVSIQVQGSNGSGGEGSGVILDTGGKVLTNNHVVDGAGQGGQVAVVLSDGRTFDATISGNDASTDLAVIQIKNAPKGLVPISLGNSDQVKVGDPVMAVGNPLGLSSTVTTGIVSATDRPVTTESSTDPTATGGDGPVVTNAIQTDAAVNPGNSGGALVDVQGRLIGINSSIASLGSTLGSSQSGSIGLGFAIPVNEARNVADQLAQGKTVQHAWLGVSVKDDEVAVDGATRQAAMLSDVNTGSPAAKAGLKSGDAVIAVDGETVNSSESLVAQLREREPGVTVTIRIVRSGAARDVPVTLAARPAN